MCRSIVCKSCPNANYVLFVPQSLRWEGLQSGCISQVAPKHGWTKRLLDGWWDPGLPSHSCPRLPLLKYNILWNSGIHLNKCIVDRHYLFHRSSHKDYMRNNATPSSRAERAVWAETSPHHRWPASIIISSISLFFKIQILFSRPSRMVENERRVETWFLLFLKSTPKSFQSPPWLWLKRNMASNAFCLTSTVRFVGKWSDFDFWRECSRAGLAYPNTPQPGYALTSRQRTSHYFVAPHEGFLENEAELWLVLEGSVIFICCQRVLESEESQGHYILWQTRLPCDKWSLHSNGSLNESATGGWYWQAPITLAAVK